MNLDGWNLFASSVAAALAAGGLVYQVRRDRRGGLAVFILRVEETDAEGRTRMVLTSTSWGDATWSLTAIEVVEPQGAVLMDHMVPGALEGRRLIIHPPVHVGSATGLYALVLRPRRAVATPGTKIALRLTLRGIDGRSASVMAFGHRR